MYGPHSSAALSPLPPAKGSQDPIPFGDFLGDVLWMGLEGEVLIYVYAEEHWSQTVVYLHPVELHVGVFLPLGRHLVCVFDIITAHGLRHLHVTDGDCDSLLSLAHSSIAVSSDLSFFSQSSIA